MPSKMFSSSRYVSGNNKHAAQDEIATIMNQLTDVMFAAKLEQRFRL